MTRWNWEEETSRTAIRFDQVAADYSRPQPEITPYRQWLEYHRWRGRVTRSRLPCGDTHPTRFRTSLQDQDAIQPDS